LKKTVQVPRELLAGEISRKVATDDYSRSAKMVKVGVKVKRVEPEVNEFFA
jgi:hypothetical protein